MMPKGGMLSSYKPKGLTECEPELVNTVSCTAVL